jgi:hypothetical protein
MKRSGGEAGACAIWIKHSSLRGALPRALMANALSYQFVIRRSACREHLQRPRAAREERGVRHRACRAPPRTALPNARICTSTHRRVQHISTARRRCGDESIAPCGELQLRETPHHCGAHLARRGRELWLRLRRTRPKHRRRRRITSGAHRVNESGKERCNDSRRSWAHSGHGTTTRDATVYAPTTISASAA